MLSVSHDVTFSDKQKSDPIGMSDRCFQIDVETITFMSNGFMNTQRIKLFGLSLVLTALPMLAATAQVSINLSDNFVPAPLAASQADAKTTNTIALNQFGGLFGQVASIDQFSKTATGLSGLDVFFVRDGEIIQQAQTNGEGEFSIKGLPEGAYSFYASGKNGLAAYGVYVTAQPQPGTQNILEAVAASTSNRALGELIQRNAPSQVAKSMQNAIQSVTRGTEVQTSKQIRLINGRLYGKISTLFSEKQPIAGLQVQLIQNSETIAQVQTGTDGAFSIPDVEPGVYDYLIGGSNGFAAGSFEAIENTSATQQVSFRKMITQLDACLTCPDASLEQPVDYAVGQDTYLEPSYDEASVEAPIEYAGESVGYGGASGGTCGACNTASSFDAGGVVSGDFGIQNGCGGTCGGGGGLGSRLGGGRILGSGNGGLRRLFRLAAIGGAIVAIADDDDDEASPFGN